MQPTKHTNDGPIHYDHVWSKQHQCYRFVPQGTRSCAVNYAVRVEWLTADVIDVRAACAANHADEKRNGS